MERKVNLKEVRDQFYQYALSEHEEDIRATLEDQCDPSRHIPIYVNFLTLSESCSVLTELLRTRGSQLLPALDLALVRAARHLYGRLTDAGAAGLTLKTRLHVRLIELPVCAELQRTCVPRIEDEGRLLCVSGTVVRAGLPHLLDTRVHYTCNKCKHQFIVYAEYEQSYQTERPLRCPNPQPCRAGAGFSPTAAPDTGPRDHQARDYQEIRLQEQVQKLDVGKIPRGLCVVLEDDLVDSCKAGDDVIVTGTVRQRWRSAVRGSPPDIELTLHANRVFVNSERRTSLLLTEQRLAQFAQFWQRYRHDPLAGRNRILQRFCSQIYGMYVVKLAVALTLVGGVRRGDGTTSTRGEPHLLLVGDPGTGKSQLLKYAARLCPRSVLTTGIGSTSAGLTCAAVKEGPEWQLEAGALVLADGGLCCIDEFNSVREADKTSIHEAMEQQTISVAKAGMVCKLNTRCSILAAANPKLPVDWRPGEDVLSRLGLGSPLLSRFDLILVLRDAHSAGWDRLVSGYILSCLDPVSCGRSQQSAETDDWSMETLQAYLAHVRTLQPQPDRRAVTVLQTYYQLLRGQQTAGRSRTTVRLLESLLRLTQAHARLRCSADGAGLCDAVVAVTLMEASLGGLGGGLLGPDGVGSILHTGFPESPADEYRAQCELILGRLGLEDLLAAELTALDRWHGLDPAGDDPSGTAGERPADRPAEKPAIPGPGPDRAEEIPSAPSPELSQTAGNPAAVGPRPGQAAERPTAAPRPGQAADKPKAGPWLSQWPESPGRPEADITELRGSGWGEPSARPGVESPGRPGADITELRESGWGEPSARPGVVASSGTGDHSGASLLDWSDCEPGGRGASTAGSTAAGSADAAGRRSRFAGLRERVAAGSAAFTAAARTTVTSCSTAVTASSAATGSRTTAAAAINTTGTRTTRPADAGTSAAADSLTRIRPAPERTAGAAAETSEVPPEPPADCRPAIQLERFRFVRPKPTGLKRTAGQSAGPAGQTTVPAAGPDRSPASVAGPSPAARGLGGISSLELEDMDGDFESLLSGGRGAAGGSRGGRRGREARPRRPVEAEGTPAASVSSKATNGGGESLAPARRPLSAATLSKLARFSADPAARSAEPLSAEGGSVPVADRSTVPVADRSTVAVADRSTVPVADRSTVPVADRSTVPVADLSTVPVADRSTVPVAGRSTVPVASQSRRPAPDCSQTRFHSADDDLGDLDLDFSWPPSKRSRS